MHQQRDLCTKQTVPFPICMHVAFTVTTETFPDSGPTPTFCVDRTTTTLSGGQKWTQLCFFPKACLCEKTESAFPTEINYCFGHPCPDNGLCAVYGGCSKCVCVCRCVCACCDVGRAARSRDEGQRTCKGRSLPP